ncbi:unnamed protein product, partial [Durusdinium trenchii]
VQQPTEDLGKQEQEAVHTESVAEVQQESPAASPQHSTTPTITQVEEARVHQPAEDLSKQEQEVEEARVQQPAEDLSKEEQEAVHTESVAEVQQESPAASPQHSTTPTVTQAHCGSPYRVSCRGAAGVKEARVQQPTEDLSKQEQEAWLT